MSRNTIREERSKTHSTIRVDVDKRNIGVASFFRFIFPGMYGVRYVSLLQFSDSDYFLGPYLTLSTTYLGRPARYGKKNVGNNVIPLGHKVDQ